MKYLARHGHWIGGGLLVAGAVALFGQPVAQLFTREPLLALGLFGMSGGAVLVMWSAALS